MSFDCAVRKHEGARFASQYLRLNAPKQKFGCFLWVFDFTQPVQEIPGDFERVFNENWKWFGHA
jgi:hypothetical protein